ncbi:MAG: EAL domain-containing protein [Clostridiales bacterium]|nr:EAL domain-containing protein [Clostridiales bacterium]
MIGSSCETSIYMIDDSYRLLYFNRALKKRFPELKKGDLCYQVLCGEEAPCKECPMAREESGMSLFYNKLKKQWLEVGTGQLEWPGCETCNAVFVREICEPVLWEKERKSGGREMTGADPITGLYRRNVFFRVAPLFLTEAEPGAFCLMSIDIEHFKLFNDWYGQEAGDRVLGQMGTYLKRLQREGSIIAGYMGGDDFALILPNDAQLLEQVQNRINACVRAYDGNTGFLPNFGIYEIIDPALSVSTMYDRALIAMDSVKGNYARRVGFYDEKMKARMEEAYHLLSEVQRALEHHEFTFYAQPKCNMSTGRIVGLESLVRWIHPERGLIPPDSFLPLLESSGLITRLDLFIWEEVCKSLRQWMDQGHRAVPISVNVSRVDLYAVDVVAVFKQLVETYDLDPSLVEIEITESAYVEEYQAITTMVEELRMAGFPVLMDDFGSGYSSLNMLRDVNVDVLKIDMRFLSTDMGSQGKGISILEAITRMANIMGMRMIAEGVETREQIDFLLNMGCTYGQGYYFYRPMPREEYEALLMKEENVDYRGVLARQMERIRLKELFNEDISSDAMLNNILGPVAFYDVHGDQLEILRVNDQYYSLMGTNAVDLEEQRHHLLDEIYPEDQPVIWRVFDQAAQRHLDGAEGTARRRRRDGSYMWFHLRAFFLREQDGHRMYYGALSDATEQKRREQQLESSQRALAAVVQVSENDASFMQLGEENRRTAASIFAQMSPGGMIGGYCEDGFPLYFANQEMVQLLGYSSYDEFEEAIDGMVINTIHHEDRDRVVRDIGPSYYAGLEYTTTYRMPKKDGSWFWTLDKGRVIKAEDGRLAIVSACTDISETMAVQQGLLESNSLLTRRNEELNFLNNDMPGGYHRCKNNEGYDFLYISNRFLEIFGYTREQIKELFDNKFMNMIHPDDREKIQGGTEEIVNNGSSATMQYRMKAADGYISVIDQTKHMQYDGKDFFQGVVMDVTEIVHLRSRLQLLMEHMPEDLMLIRREEAGFQCEPLAGGFSAKLGCAGEVYEETMKRFWSCEDHPWKSLNRLKIRLEEVWEKGENFHEELPLDLQDGSCRWVGIEACYIGREEDSQVYLLVCSDITHIKEKEQELWFKDKKTESMLQLAGINGWEWDVKEDVFTFTSIVDTRMVRLFTGVGGGLIRRIPDFTRRFRAWKTIWEGKEGVLDFISQVTEGETEQELSAELCMEDASGAVWISAAGHAVCNETGRPATVVGYCMDITEKKEKQQELVRMAETDALTGLLNRQSAIPRIQQYLRENPDANCAFLMFDLDNFKLANDVFGHAYGDRLLIQSSEQLKKSFRSEDILCRLGGDEFVVLCKNISEDAIQKKLERLLEEMSVSCCSGSREIFFSASAGYTMVPGQGREFEELYHKADIALFAAKMSGKCVFRKYDPSMKVIRYELAKAKRPDTPT